MTKEEFENRTIKDIVTECRKAENCFECPFEGEKYMCIFHNTACEWIKDYMERQNKVL